VQKKRLARWGCGDRRIDSSPTASIVCQAKAFSSKSVLQARTTKPRCVSFAWVPWDQPDLKDSPHSRGTAVQVRVANRPRLGLNELELAFVRKKRKKQAKHA